MFFRQAAHPLVSPWLIWLIWLVVLLLAHITGKHPPSPLCDVCVTPLFVPSTSPRLCSVHSLNLCLIFLSVLLLLVLVLVLLLFEERGTLKAMSSRGDSPSPPPLGEGADDYQFEENPMARCDPVDMENGRVCVCLFVCLSLWGLLLTNSCSNSRSCAIALTETRHRTRIPLASPRLTRLVRRHTDTDRQAHTGTQTHRHAHLHNLVLSPRRSPAWLLVLL